MKKALVTGATGFLGRHLCSRLRSSGFELYISNTKVANLDNIENLRIYDGISFDYIFHLAAITKAGDYALTHSGEQWLNNQTINTNILTYWKKFQPQAKMICMGTSCSYMPGIQMKEGNYLIGEPEESLYTYAMTKRMLLVGLQSLSKQYGLKWLYFIPSTLYGPNFELDDNHFIFDFIRNCYIAKYNNGQFTIWGDGEQKRELVYIDDAVEAIVKLRDNNNEIFNLGSGEDYSINDFARMVCEVYEYDFNLIQWDLTKYVGAKEKKLNVEKLNKILLEHNNISLEDGLKTSIKYFVSQIAKLQLYS